jgi:cytosine/adenosine deaminase-related metal-dependent hydrolase
VRSTDVLASPGELPARAATVLFTGGAVADGASDGPGAVPVLDAGSKLVLPAFSNGHDHGKPLGPLSYGVDDSPLEVWLPGTATAPRLPQTLASLAFFARQARTGVAASLHLHTLKSPDVLVDDAVAVAAAAEAVGIRTAFGVPLHDRQHLLYGPDHEVDEVLSACGVHARDVPIIPGRIPSTQEAIDLVDEIAARVTSPLVTVQFGPLGPQWITDELGEAIAERSAATGRRIHMHLFETRRQREWADAHVQEGLVVHLDRLGLLSPRLSVAHGVQLRPDELDLLAERGVTVATNASSNLRLHNGVAPVAEWVRRGVPWGVGLDGRAFDDDADYLRELRLLRHLHSGSGLRRALPDAALWRAAVDGGARAVHGGPGPYGLAPGAPADVVTIDAERIGADVMEPFRDPSLLLLGRATTADVCDVVVAGRLVVDGGRVVGVDEGAVWDELLDRLAAATGDQCTRAEVYRRLLPHVQAWYEAGGHRR